MQRTRIKICGVCRVVDARAAVEAGADAIGLNFDPVSARCVSIEQASEIVETVGPFVWVVGVFVNADRDAIGRVMKQIPLSAVQLHGRERPEFVVELAPTRVIKAVRTDEEDALAPYQNLANLAGVLMETPASIAGVPGGSGVENNWTRLRELQKAHRFDGLGALIVAGGLTPQNVGDVVRMLRPFAVDVSSGVESAKREKSAQKIAAFVRAVREADGQLDS